MKSSRNSNLSKEGKTSSKKRKYLNVDNNAAIAENALVIIEGDGVSQKTYAMDEDKDQWCEVKTAARINSSRFKYLDDGADVPDDVEIIEQGTGKFKKKYVIIRNENNEEIARREVKTAPAFRRSRLKYVDNGADVPADTEIIEQGTGRIKKKYAITRNENNEEIARREVKTAGVISVSRLKYVDNGTLVPADAEIIEEGTGKFKKKYAIIRNENNEEIARREVKTASSICVGRLKYVDDGTDMPADAEIIEEGTGKFKKKYAITRNENNEEIARREVKTAGVISVSRLKFVDNGALVPDNAEIIEQGTGKLKKKYAITRNENNEEVARREVKSAAAISHSRLKYADNGTLVSDDAEIIEEGTGKFKKKYAIIRNENNEEIARREVKTATTFRLSRLKIVENGADLPADAETIEQRTENFNKSHAPHNENHEETARREVNTAGTINVSLKYVDDGTQVQADAEIIEEGTGKFKKKYVITRNENKEEIARREVKSAAAFRLSRLKYVDNGADVPDNAEIIEQGTGKFKKKYVIIRNENNEEISRREVKTAGVISVSRLKYVDNGTDVPADVEIIEQGTGKFKKKYVITRNENKEEIARREVKSADTISKSRLKYVDNGTDVPADVEIIEQGTGRIKKKYVITRNEHNEEIARREVKSADAISYSRLKYVDNGTDVTGDVEIIELGRGKKYVITRNEHNEEVTFREVKSATAISKIYAKQANTDVIATSSQHKRSINNNSQEIENVTKKQKVNKANTAKQKISLFSFLTTKNLQTGLSPIENLQNQKDALSNPTPPFQNINGIGKL